MSLSLKAIAQSACARCLKRAGLHAQRRALAISADAAYGSSLPEAASTPAAPAQSKHEPVAGPSKLAAPRLVRRLQARESLVHTSTQLLVDMIIHSAESTSPADLFVVLDELVARSCERDIGIDGLRSLAGACLTQLREGPAPPSSAESKAWQDRLRRLEELAVALSATRDVRFCSVLYGIYAELGSAPQAAAQWIRLSHAGVQVDDAAENVLLAFRRASDAGSVTQSAARQQLLPVVLDILERNAARKIDLPRFRALLLSIHRHIGDWRAFRSVVKTVFGIDLELPARPGASTAHSELTSDALEQCVRAQLAMRGKKGLSEALALIENVATYRRPRQDEETSLEYLVSGSSAPCWQDSYTDQFNQRFPPQDYRDQPEQNAFWFPQMRSLDWLPCTPLYDLRLMNANIWLLLIEACAVSGSSQSNLSTHLFEQMCLHARIAAHMLRYAVTLRGSHLGNVPAALADIVCLPSPAHLSRALQSIASADEHWKERALRLFSIANEAVAAIDTELAYLREIVASDNGNAGGEGHLDFAAYDVRMREQSRRLHVRVDDLTIRMLDALKLQRRALWAKLQPERAGPRLVNNDSSNDIEYSAENIMSVGKLYGWVFSQLPAPAYIRRTASSLREGRQMRYQHLMDDAKAFWRLLPRDWQHLAASSSAESLAQMTIKAAAQQLSASKTVRQMLPEEKASERENFLARPSGGLAPGDTLAAQALVALQRFPHLEALLHETPTKEPAPTQKARFSQARAKYEARVDAWARKGGPIDALRLLLPSNHAQLKAFKSTPFAKLSRDEQLVAKTVEGLQAHPKIHASIVRINKRQAMELVVRWSGRTHANKLLVLKEMFSMRPWQRNRLLRRPAVTWPRKYSRLLMPLRVFSSIEQVLEVYSQLSTKEETLPAFEAAWRLRTSETPPTRTLLKNQQKGKVEATHDEREVANILLALRQFPTVDALAQRVKMSVNSPSISVGRPKQFRKKSAVKVRVITNLNSRCEMADADLDQLEDALRDIDRSEVEAADLERLLVTALPTGPRRSWASNVVRSFPNPGLSVPGVGTIRLPINFEQAQRLSAVAQPAVARDGTRIAFKVPATSLSFSHAHWQQWVDATCRKSAAANFGLDADSLQLQLSCLCLVFEGGSFLLPDLAKEPSSYGRLLISLPVDSPAQADLRIRTWKDERVSLMPEDAFSARVLCYHHGPPRLFEPLRSSHGIILVYDLRCMDIERARLVPAYPQQASLEAFLRSLSGLGGRPAVIALESFEAKRSRSEQELYLRDLLFDGALAANVRAADRRIISLITTLAVSASWSSCHYNDIPLTDVKHPADAVSIRSPVVAHLATSAGASERSFFALAVISRFSLWQWLIMSCVEASIEVAAAWRAIVETEMISALERCISSTEAEMVKALESELSRCRAQSVALLRTLIDVALRRAALPICTTVIELCTTDEALGAHQVLAAIARFGATTMEKTSERFIGDCAARHPKRATELLAGIQKLDPSRHGWSMVQALRICANATAISSDVANRFCQLLNIFGADYCAQRAAEASQASIASPFWPAVLTILHKDERVPPLVRQQFIARQLWVLLHAQVKRAPLVALALLKLVMEYFTVAESQLALLPYHPANAQALQQHSLPLIAELRRFYGPTWPLDEELQPLLKSCFEVAFEEYYAPHRAVKVRGCRLPSHNVSTDAILPVSSSDGQTTASELDAFFRNSCQHVMTITVRSGRLQPSSWHLDSTVSFEEDESAATSEMRAYTARKLKLSSTLKGPSIKEAETAIAACAQTPCEICAELQRAIGISQALSQFDEVVEALGGQEAFQHTMKPDRDAPPLPEMPTFVQAARQPFESRTNRPEETPSRKRKASEDLTRT